MYGDTKSYRIITLDGEIIFTAPAGLITETKPFRNGVSPVKSNGLWAVMNTAGQWIVPPTYTALELV